MASSTLRLRQTLRTVTTFHRSLAACSATSASPFSASIQHPISSTSKSPLQSSRPPYLMVQSRAFRASSISLLSARSTYNNNEEIGPDTILFEGCDYNHWLIVMDFPKDPKPTPEQMVQTYEETCAKGLNISVEEAKKKMYACSTTTYTGFQAVMTEEESEKFQGLPGVIFVLPDSYIDPVNKEYGGDKYINGVIIPRPPPIQYGRSQGRRNRNFDQTRQGSPMSNPPGNPSYNNQGSMQRDRRNYGPSQNYPPQQNYGPASQNYPPQQNYGPSSQNYPPQQNYGPASQNYPPQQNYGPASQNYPPQQTYGSASQHYEPNSPQQSFGPPGQGERRDSVPTSGGAGAYQVQRGNPFPSYQNNINQAGQRNYYPQDQRGFQQGYPNAGQGDWAADHRNYNKSSETGNYGQGVATPGTGGPYGQGEHPGYGQNISGHVENQGFTQRDQGNAQGEEGGYPPFPQTGTDQRRY